MEYVSVVWKFPLVNQKPEDDNEFEHILPEEEPPNMVDVVIEMPLGAHILSVHAQGGVPTIWAVVSPDPECPKEKRTFRIVPTGEPAPYGKFLGTCVRANPVVHVWELTYSAEYAVAQSVTANIVAGVVSGKLTGISIGSIG